MTQVVELQESSVMVDGARIHYWRAGTGPALVLLHGLVGSARNWEHNIEALAQYRTVYALDHANMGESERVKGLDSGLEASMERVVASMDALGIESADLVGHSHGGSMAMLLAARHPERVRRLVLFAAANPHCKRAMLWVRYYRSPLGWVAAHAMPFLPERLHRRALRAMFGDPSRIRESTFAGYKSQLDLATVGHVLGILRSWKPDMELLDEAIGRLTGVPTLVIWGGQDKAVGLDSGEVLAGRLGAELVVLPGVGHVAFQESPEECNRVVGEWLTQSPA
jgi:pimeloyl-ACP methyl ester carboxylesterase